MPDGRHVESVLRALSILDAFTIEDARLGLAELSRRCGLPKSTCLRLARTLAARGYLSATDDAAWRPGPSAARLGARYEIAFDLHRRIEPVMRELVALTGRNVSYYVAEGKSRIRLLHVPGPLGLAGVRAGEALPMDRGAAGGVLLAFSGRKGELFDRIRQDGFHATVLEATRVAGSIAAPVFGRGWNVVGAMCIAMPASEASIRALRRYVRPLKSACESLSRKMISGSELSRPLTIARSTWHPG